MLDVEPSEKAAGRDFPGELPIDAQANGAGGKWKIDGTAWVALFVPRALRNLMPLPGCLDKSKTSSYKRVMKRNRDGDDPRNRTPPDLNRAQPSYGDYYC